jgi:DNA-binding NtrC family response regulator
MTLPPLRERRSDIPLLAEHFVEKFARQQRKAIDTIPGEVMAALLQHDWPGNIRELQNVVERGVIMTTGPVLSRQAIEPLTGGEVLPVRAAAAADPTSMKAMADVERAHITATLRATKWVVGGPRGAPGSGCRGQP